jgi:hypothetical protein
MRSTRVLADLRPHCPTLISNDSLNQSQSPFCGSAIFGGETKRNRSRTILQHKESGMAVDVPGSKALNFWTKKRPEGTVFAHFGAHKGDSFEVR